MLPIVKRRKGCQQYPEQTKDEQAVSESSLNKLVGAAEAYNLDVRKVPAHTVSFLIICLNGLESSVSTMALFLCAGNGTPGDSHM